MNFLSVNHVFTEITEAEMLDLLEDDSAYGAALSTGLLCVQGCTECGTALNLVLHLVRCCTDYGAAISTALPCSASFLAAISVRRPGK